MGILNTKVEFILVPPVNIVPHIYLILPLSGSVSQELLLNMVANFI